MTYAAGLVKEKRARACNSEMEERARFLIQYATAHGPMTVRGLFYQATVAGVPGITKDEQGYAKVQRQVLALRRSGDLPYNAIADATRYMRKPETFNGIEAALQNTADFYRKSLWAETDLKVEIWIEKSALAGAIYPVTAEYDVPLMPTGGFSSETFAHDAVEAMRGNGRELVVFALYDFDRSGVDASNSLREKLERFGREYGVRVHFENLGLTVDQVKAMALPTRPAKRTTVADKRWPYDFAAELDAIPPDVLRGMVRDAIEQFLPRGELEKLKRIEALERETLHSFIVGGAR